MCLKFNLLPETLFLTTNLMDRYLSVHALKSQDMPLLGISALLIATKYEEIYPPGVKDFVYVSKNTLTREDILDMEMSILTTIEFDI